MRRMLSNRERIDAPIMLTRYVMGLKKRRLFWLSAANQGNIATKDCSLERASGVLKRKPSAFSGTSRGR